MRFPGAEKTATRIGWADAFCPRLKLNHGSSIASFDENTEIPRIQFVNSSGLRQGARRAEQDRAIAAGASSRALRSALILALPYLFFHCLANLAAGRSRAAAGDAGPAKERVMASKRILTSLLRAALCLCVPPPGGRHRHRHQQPQFLEPDDRTHDGLAGVDL